MSDVSRLIGVMKTAALEAVETEKPAEYVIGTVEEAGEKLKIRISQKILLEGSFLVLTRNVTDFTTELSFDDPEIKQVFTTWDMEEEIESPKEKICYKNKVKHKITIYNALKEGEKVLLLRQKGGNQYLVLDRLGDAL